jgi:molecular chaperone DnaK (HSP70)
MPIIPVDLETSNSAVAALRRGRPIIIPSDQGITQGKGFPSYAALAARGKTIVGEPAGGRRGVECDRVTADRRARSVAHVARAIAPSNMTDRQG